MKPRAFGNESEYAVSEEREVEGRYVWSPVRAKLLPKLLFDTFPDSTPHPNIPRERWGVTGFRFYQDVGRHPELATPECSNPKQLALYTSALDCFMRDSLDEINPALFESLNYRIILGCNNDARRADGGGRASYGNHLNISCHAQTYEHLNAVAEKVAPFLATAMTTWDGTLRVWVDDNCKLCVGVSQRMHKMKHLTGSNTMDDRGIVDLRDEPHTSDNRFRRLHIIGPDKHRSEFVVWLRAGMTALVIEMAEDRSYRMPVTMTEASFEQGKDVANRDFSGLAKVWRVGRTKRSSIEIQKLYLDAARDYFHGDDDAAEIIEEMDRVLRLYVEDRWALVREIEWLNKSQMLSRYSKQKFGTVEWRKVAEEYPHLFEHAALMYTMLNEVGPYDSIEEEGRVRHLFREKDIKIAMAISPADTRASDRGELVKHVIKGDVKIETINWARAKIHVVKPKVRRNVDVLFQGLPGKCGRTCSHSHVSDLF